MDLFYIYKITNNLNGKTYIGQHKYNSDKHSDDYESLITDGYWGSGILINKAYTKYGLDNFAKDILVSHLECKEAADEAEKVFIKCYKETGKAEYNIADGGIGGALKGFTGHHHSEESKLKTSLAISGSNNGMYGKHHSEETKKKMSQKAFGHKRCLGHHQSEESKVKNRLAHLGKHPSEESRKKMSQSRKGQHWFNNGITSTRAFECPEGFVPGRLKR